MTNATSYSSPIGPREIAKFRGWCLGRGTRRVEGVNKRPPRLSATPPSITHETQICFVGPDGGELTRRHKNRHLRKMKCNKMAKNCKKWKIYFLQKIKPAEILGFLLVGLPKDMQFTDSCKLRKPAPTARFPKSKHLQKNQGFFASVFFRKTQKFFGGFPAFFDFRFCPEIVAKKPWFFYHDHE